MSKYVKKAIEVEAFQLDARGLVAEDWFWDEVTKGAIITHYFGKYHIKDAWCEIRTLEGVMTAHTGDYIIRGVKGEVYPCKADIFEMSYELVKETTEEFVFDERNNAFIPHKTPYCAVEFPTENDYAGFIEMIDFWNEHHKEKEIKTVTP